MNDKFYNIGHITLKNNKLQHYFYTTKKTIKGFYSTYLLFFMQCTNIFVSFLPNRPFVSPKGVDGGLPGFLLRGIGTLPPIHNLRTGTLIARRKDALHTNEMR